MEAITEFDFSILDALQKIHSPALNVIMAIFTYLGEAAALWLVLGVIFICIKNTRKMGNTIMMSIFFEGVISELIVKNIFRRERPFNVHPWIDTIIHQPSSYSFPSGHACTAFCAATAIFWYNKKLGSAAYVVAAMIAFSRLYFYIHFPTDVLCGAVEGILLGSLAVLAVKEIYSSKEEKKQESSTASEEQ